MGDKIAQLFFEKIKTPTVVETDSLEETGRGDRGFGSTGIRPTETKSNNQDSVQESGSDQSIKTQQASSDQNEKCMKQFKNEPIPHIIRRSQASKTRHIITARQIQKLAKQGQRVFLAIIRPAQDVSQRRDKRGGNKKSPVYATTVHGMIEGQKRKSAKKLAQRKTRS